MITGYDSRYLVVDGTPEGTNDLQLYVGDKFVRFSVLATKQILAANVPFSEVPRIISHLQGALDGVDYGP